MHNRFLKILAPVAFALYCILALCTPAGAQMVTVAASNVVDSTGAPLASGTITFQPSKCTTSYSANCNTSYRIGSKGQALSSAVSATITNGAFTIQLPDTNATNPQNVCFAASIKDAATGDTVSSQAYACVQPGTQSANSNWCSTANSTTTCNFDSFVPNIAGLVLTTIAGGAGGTTTFNGGTINGPVAFQSTVSLAADPTLALQAATKQYVDAHAGNGGFSGGTVANATTFQSSMVWAFALRKNGADLNALTTCGYYDGSTLTNGPAAFGTAYMEIQNVCSADANYLWQFAYDMANASGTYYARYRDASGWHAWVQQNTGGGSFTGGTVSGATTFSSTVTLAADPKSALQAATKQYTDYAPAGSARERVLYDKSYWTSLSDFTASGATTSAAGGSVTMTPTVGGSFSGAALTLNNLTTSTDQIDFEVTVQSPSAVPGTGFFIGRDSGFPVCVQFSDLSSTPKIDFWQQCENTAVTANDFSTTTAGALSVSSGDTYRITYSQRGDNITATVFDITSNTTASATVRSKMLANGASGFYLPSTGTLRFGALDTAVAFKVLRVRVLDAQVQNPFLACVGDSKTVGYAATSTALRYCNLLPFGPSAVFAGAGDTTAQALTDLASIIAVHPQNVLLAIGSNDIRSGVSSATWQANYSSIVSQLKAAGIRVVHLLPIPENTGAGGVDQSALKSYIQTTFSGDTQIDPSSGWDTSTMNASDGVHPSLAGHAYIAQVITASGAFSATEPLVAYSAPSSTTASASSGGVTQIVAGTNISISPSGGTGVVTVNASASGSGPTTGSVTVDPTYLSGTITFDPYGYDLAYITGNATITIAAPRSSAQGGVQQLIRLVNFGANTVTITGTSTTNQISTPGTTYCTSGCPGAAYTVAANHTVELIANAGGWIIAADYSHP